MQLSKSISRSLSRSIARGVSGGGTSYLAKTISLTGGDVEEKKFIILNLHKGSKWLGEGANDVFLNNRCRNDFSDIRLYDTSGNQIPYKMLATGNYDIVEEVADIQECVVRKMSDGNLIASIGKIIHTSSDNGRNWDSLNVSASAFFNTINDTLLIYRTNPIIYRSTYPYSTETAVMDYTDVNGGLIPSGIGQLDSGEIIMGRYQLIYGLRIYKSSDDGATWSLCYSDDIHQHTHQVRIDRSTTPNTIYVGLDSAGFAVIKSTDKGETWIQLPVTELAMDHGVIYADPNYRLITGETSIMPYSHSLQKTVDDVNFYPVLDYGKGIYTVRKINGVLYGCGVSSYRTENSVVLRSLDDGETWQLIYTSSPFNNNAMSDGWKYAGDPVDNSYTATIQDSSDRRKSIRITGGGNNYMAAIIAEVNVPPGGLDLQVKSFDFNQLDVATLEIPFDDTDTIIHLPLNEGSGNILHEIITNTDIILPVSPNWYNGIKKFYNSHPAIIQPGYEKSVGLYKQCYHNTTLPIDLSSGNFTVSFWTKIPSRQSDYVALSDILFSIKSGNVNKAAWRLGNTADGVFIVDYNASGVSQIIGYVNGCFGYSVLITITVDSIGNTVLYANGAILADNSKINASGPLTLADYAGDLRMFGWFFDASTSVPYRHPISDFRIIGRMLTEHEISNMYGGLVTDLHD